MILKRKKTTCRPRKPSRLLFRSLAFLALLLGGAGCREVYNPDDLVSGERIPVIQGMIRENEAPGVDLVWAMAYNDRQEEPISGAQVTITDSEGISAELPETGSGHYTVSGADFKGIAGRSYTLRVTLNDGSVYESNPVLLQEAAFDDSIYAEPGIRDLISYGENNQPVIEQQEGLQVYADVFHESGAPEYYRFETKVTQEMSKTVDLGSLNSHPVYSWRTYMLGTGYAVGHSATDGPRQVLLEQPIGFLRYFYDANLETETSTAPYTDAWVIIFKVYRISSDVYQYYHSIANQLGSNDQMFAPDPSQVNSNVICTTDPARKVIGVFEASACKTIYQAFSWVSPKRYKSKPIPYFPPNISGGEQERFAPDFWIFF
jgi:hypothetical protein